MWATAIDAEKVKEMYQHCNAKWKTLGPDDAIPGFWAWLLLHVCIR
jgi:hypothetical protein